MIFRVIPILVVIYKLCRQTTAHAGSEVQEQTEFHGLRVLLLALAVGFPPGTMLA